jgi:hypothetical protein
MLTAPPITETALEAGSLALFAEFLSGYFDGLNHAIGTNAPQLFPKAEILFQQSSASQPLNGVAISVIMARPGRVKKYLDWSLGRRMQRAQARVTWTFIVRAAGPETGAGNAKKKCQDASDLLFGLLDNPVNTFPLAEAGIRHLRPETPGVVSEGMASPQSDLRYAMRMFACPGTLRWIVNQ